MNKRNWGFPSRDMEGKISVISLTVDIVVLGCMLWVGGLVFLILASIFWAGLKSIWGVI